MKKKFLILPVLAALFAACTSDELVVVDNQTQQTEEDAIAFDAYLTRSVTRAGAVGGIDLAKLQTTGFGVFGYYANGDLYSENAIPDFMYNQEVKYSGGWEYSPIKYWPNEFGSTAVSTGVDRVTFFAYAPYVGVDPATGQLTSYYDNSTPEKSTETGITALTRNGKTGDPYVRYVGAFKPADCVDLLYGVAAENYTSSVGAADGANSIKKGDPYINVAKPEVNSRLKFDFKHALAQLNVQVDADVDVVSHTGVADEVDNNTRIWVRSISFDGIAQRGYLNLNNGIWYDVIDNTKISHANVTVHDGRRDGAEALADDSYETPIGFTPALVQKVEYTTEDGTTDTGAPTYTSVTTTGYTGVTGMNQSLFEGGSVLVIPANEQLKVTIVYDVETADPTLSTYLSDGKTKGSTVENKITKSITLDGKALKLEPGNKYTLSLHLGMTSVKFDAQVSEWSDEKIADNTWLPENLLTVAAGPAALYNYNVPAAGGDYSIKITGLTATSAKAETGSSAPYSSLSSLSWTADDPASSGILAFTVPTNTSVNKKSYWAKLTETGDVSTVTTINISQAAAPLGLGVSAVDGTAKTITLSKKADNGWDNITDAMAEYGDPAKKRIQVKRGDTDLTNATSLSDENDFTFAAGVITLNKTIVAGDVFTITVKASDDVEEETFVAKIGAISYGTLPVPKVKNAANFIKTPTKTGTGSLEYSISNTGTASTINTTTGEVTVGANVGTATITATVTDDKENGWYYLTETASYEMSVGEVVFTAGGNYEWACSSTGEVKKLVICGLTKDGTVSVAETKDDNNISSGEILYAGHAGTGAAGKAGGTGIAQLNTTLASNSGSVKTAVLTITDNGKTMTITIKQAY